MTEITEESRRKFSGKKIIIGCSVLFSGLVTLALLAAGIFARSLIVTLEPDEVAVVLSPYEPNGISETPLTPGRHFLRPTERLEIFKVSREKFLSASTDCNCPSQPAAFRTKDDIEVIIDYQVTYVIDANQVVKLYQTWQHRYQDGFVAPKSKQVVEEVASQYTSTEIALTKRNEVEEEIFSRLKSDFSESYLIVLEFKINDVRLSK
jgi:regulator of protease activity HflC (stomatin/prohibitin superfamily)